MSTRPEIIVAPPQWWRQIAAFDREVFGADSWPEAVWHHELAFGQAHYRALVAPGDILVGVGALAPGIEAEILTIGIAANQRGRGYGKLLLDELLAIAKTHGAEAVFLEVRAGDPVAQGLYSGAGFEVVGRRKNYYHDDDALIMRKSE